MNAEDILGTILLFAFVSICLGLAGIIWIFVWESFEETEIGSAISKKIIECIERDRDESHE